ncbi:MAG: alpha/beta hydrolase [Fimbriimonadaceae bacterium]|nr:alpha/beta hydrolase [Fimbriimonadaceae bacterium]
MPRGQAIPLWPAGAPGLDSASPAFNPTITPYPLESPQPHGAVIVCPGGGYAGRAPHEGQPIAEMLNAQGVSSFVLDYRVAPYRHPWPLGDAQRALRWVRHHAGQWRIDPQRVGILGFSAGGHLAGSAATHWDEGQAEATDPIDRQPCRPNAAVLCYAVLSFEKFRHTGSMSNLLGPNPPDELRRSLSCELQVNAATPPTFLWHTAADPGVPVENSLMFASALSAHQVPFALHVYPRGRHGLGLAPDEPYVATWATLCGQWLAELGWTVKP